MPRYHDILIICHANTSRSIMAEALLKGMLHRRGIESGLAVRSAGVAPYARDGALVSLDAQLVLREEGLDAPAKQTSTDLKHNRHMVAGADLILAMTREQIEMLRAEFPEASGKVVCTLKEFAGSSGDIADPAGLDEEAYAACRDEIKTALEGVVERLAPADGERGERS